MCKSEFKKGFTVIEILLVLFLLTVSVSLTLLYYRSAQTNADLKNQVESFASYLRVEQSNAEAGLNDTSHGIHLEENSYFSFEGAAYDPMDVTNFEYPLPASIIIQNINLNGGGSDIVFTQPNGETSNFGTLDFYSAASTTTKTVTIKSNGVITYQ